MGEEKTWEEKLREYMATNDRTCYSETSKRSWNFGAIDFAFHLGLIDNGTLHKLIKEFVE